jgi:hypothetical protein
MHDIDVLGCDQAFQPAGAAPEFERVDGGVHERNPFATERVELRCQRSVLGCDQRARARLHERRHHDERRAGYGFLAQGRYDLQHGCAGQAVRGNVRVVVICAHLARFLDRLRISIKTSLH